MRAQRICARLSVTCGDSNPLQFWGFCVWPTFLILVKRRRGCEEEESAWSSNAAFCRSSPHSRPLGGDFSPRCEEAEMVVRVLGGGTGAKIRRVFKFQGKRVAWRSWREEDGKRGRQEKSEGARKCLAASRPGNRYLCVFWGSS